MKGLKNGYQILYMDVIWKITLQIFISQFLLGLECFSVGWKFIHIQLEFPSDEKAL